RDLSTSKNSVTIRPFPGAISALARRRCQPREDSGSCRSSVETRAHNANLNAPSGSSVRVSAIGSLSFHGAWRPVLICRGLLCAGRANDLQKRPRSLRGEAGRGIGENDAQRRFASPSASGVPARIGDPTLLSTAFQLVRRYFFRFGHAALTSG